MKKKFFFEKLLILGTKKITITKKFRKLRKNFVVHQNFKKRRHEKNKNLGVLYTNKKLTKNVILLKVYKRKIKSLKLISFIYK